MPQKGKKGARDVVLSGCLKSGSCLCGPLRISAISALSGSFNAETAEIRGGPQRRSSKSDSTGFVRLRGYELSFGIMSGIERWLGLPDKEFKNELE
jgi:hypothetical protein